jgi:hypothetical protein
MKISRPLPGTKLNQNIIKTIGKNRNLRFEIYELE